MGRASLFILLALALVLASTRCAYTTVANEGAGRNVLRSDQVNNTLVKRQIFPPRFPCRDRYRNRDFIDACYSLAAWEDASQNGGGPDNYAARGGMIQFTVPPTGPINPKVRLHSHRFIGPGRHHWRVYTPMFQPGDWTTVAAFLWFNDMHELDFEIGYGSAGFRAKTGARPDQLVAYVTSQTATDGSRLSGGGGGGGSDVGREAVTSHVAIAGNAWHDLVLDVTVDRRSGRYGVAWYIDGRVVQTRAEPYGPRAIAPAGFWVYLSLENYAWMADGHPPPPADPARRNHAFFSGYRFQSLACNRRLGPPRRFPSGPREEADDDEPQTDTSSEEGEE